MGRDERRAIVRAKENEMAPLDFKIPDTPARTFTAHRSPPEDVGEHIELRPTNRVQSSSGTTILAFCLSLDEARALGAELIALAGPVGHTCGVLGPCGGDCKRSSAVASAHGGPFKHDGGGPRGCVPGESKPEGV